MSNLYAFESNWQVQAPLQEVVETLFDWKAWMKWWPGLESAKVNRASEKIVGSEISCVWRSAIGYRLKTTIEITDYRASKFLAFNSTGDLVGEGSWLFAAKPLLTEIIITWEVITTKSWMNVLSPFLKPLFAYNHRKLMRQGERGLNRYMHHRDRE